MSKKKIKIEVVLKEPQEKSRIDWKTLLISAILDIITGLIVSYIASR